MLRSMTGGTVNAAMTARVFVQLSRLFKLEIRSSLFVAAGTCWFVDPRATKRISNSRHRTMTLGAADSLRSMVISLAIGLETRMTCVTRISKFGYRRHPRGM